MKKYIVFILILMFPFLWLVYAQSGRESMEKVISRSPWKDMENTSVLTIQDSSGNKRIRKIKVYSKEAPEKENKILMKFISPPDARDIGLLIIEHPERDDDRYFYLPALRKTKKILASGKGGSFMQSDFTFYDIGKPEIHDFKYTEVGKKKINSTQCEVIEAIPVKESVKEEIGYSKIVHYVDTNRYLILQSDYYNKDGVLFKKYKAEEVEKIGEESLITRMVMENIVYHRKSILEMKDIRINQGLPEYIFTRRFLKKRIGESY